MFQAEGAKRVYLSRELSVSHTGWRSSPDLSEPGGGLRDEHALRSLQRCSCFQPPALTRLEAYFLTPGFPSGILYGTMTLELGGQITIACEKTGYSAQLEFKLKVG